MPSRTINAAYLIEAPRERVYRHWISEQTIIPPAARLEIEPEVGGIYRLIMPDGMTMTGRFGEVEPMQRLCYSWRWDGADETTEVRVEFLDLEAGCEVRITHAGFLSSKSMERHRTGWDSYIAGFGEFLRKSA